MLQKILGAKNPHCTGDAMRAANCLEEDLARTNSNHTTGRCSEHKLIFYRQGVVPDPGVKTRCARPSSWTEAPDFGHAAWTLARPICVARPGSPERTAHGLGS